VCVCVCVCVHLCVCVCVCASASVTKPCSLVASGGGDETNLQVREGMQEAAGGIQRGRMCAKAWDGEWGW